jgi:hypothetical protein
MKGYPKWFVPGLTGTLALLFITGILLAPATLAMRAEIAVPWRLSESSRVLCAALHAAGGFALMLLTGALWSMHMRSGWRRGKQRASGLILSTVLLMLAASAVVIYYAGDERVGVAAALFHLAAGFILVCPFGWHWRRGRRASRHTISAGSLSHEAQLNQT